MSIVKYIPEIIDVLVSPVPETLPPMAVQKVVLNDAARTASDTRLREKTAARLLALKVCEKAGIGNSNSTEIKYRSSGQPYLVAENESTEVSWSHCHGYVAAVTAPISVGVDIERCDRPLPLNRIQKLTEVCWHDQELAELVERDAFFKRWVVKEALLKGCGLGLSAGMDKISVDIGCEPPVIRSCAVDALKNRQWALHYQRLKIGNDSLHLAGAALSELPWRVSRCPPLW